MQNSFRLSPFLFKLKDDKFNNYVARLLMIAMIQIVLIFSRENRDYTGDPGS